MAMSSGPTQARYAVVRTNPAFRSLLASRFTSAAGTYLASVALTIEIYDRTSSLTWVAALMLIQWVPSLALATFAAPLLDRWSRRRVMIGSDLANLAVFCALPFTTSVSQIVLLVLVSGVATGFFAPLVYAGVPNLVEKGDLPVANSLLQLADSTSKVVGPTVGGILVAASGYNAAFLINAVSFALSAFFIARIPAHRLQQERAPRQGYFREVHEGFRLLVVTPAVLAVTVSWSIVLFSFAGLNVAEPAMAKTVLHAGDVGFGLLVTGSGAGFFAGVLLAPWLIEKLTLSVTHTTAIFVCVIGLGAGSIAPSIWLAIGCLAVFGVGNGLAVASNSLLLQQGTSDQTRGRIIVAVMGIGNTAAVIGYLVAGPFAEAHGARAAWLAAASLGLLGALASRVLLARTTAAPRSAALGTHP